MAYVSPRSPPQVIKSKEDKTFGDCKGNTATHSNSFDNNTKDSQNDGGKIAALKVNPSIDSPVLGSNSNLFSSDGKASPKVCSPAGDRERGRGRSRERHVASNSPVMSVARETMGTATPNTKDGDPENNDGARPTPAKSPARIVARRRPSPKRCAAPSPPNPRSCPSPAPKPVSTSDVSPADVEGWLLDQLRGRHVWCVLSDMLFCVFQQPEATSSKQVLVLPGCSVRVLEFKSAHLHLNTRRGIHQARLNSTTSSTSASSGSVLCSNMDDNNNKQFKHSSQCNVNGVATRENDVPCNGGEAVSQLSSSSSIRSQSASDSESRGGSVGSDGSSIFSNNSNSIITNNGHQSPISILNTKTVSGVDRFQFVIENTITRQKHMFAVASRSELDMWTQALHKACSLDMNNKDSLISSKDSNQESREKTTNHTIGRSAATKDLIMTDDSDNVTSNGKAKTVIASPRSKHKSSEGSMSPTYTPRQTLPSRIDVHSLSLSLTQPHDVSKETVDEIRRKLKKDNHTIEGIESKSFPLKATHQLDESIVNSPRIDLDSTTATNVESPRKGRHFFKGRSPLDVLLGRKKRSASADDAYNRNRKMFPVYKRSEDNLSNPSFSPRQAGSTGSQQSLASSSHSSQSHQGHRTHDSSFSTISADSRDSPRGHQAVSVKSRKQRDSPLARSWDPEMKTSRGFGASFRRTASDLKERVFGGSNGTLSTTKTPQQETDKSKPPGLKLKDLSEAKVKGHLQYRIAYKFAKVFCVLSKGCFYAFKSEKPEEIPLLAMVLSPCSVTYVVESELQLHRKKSKQKQSQRLFAFKLSQPHCKSIYACADNQQTLMQWVMAIQAEACKVQVDEELASEIREKPSSLKKKYSKEFSGISSMKTQLLETSTHSNIKMDPRLSCPSFDEASLKIALAARANNSRESTLNGLITPRRGPESTSAGFQKAKEKEEKRWRDKAKAILSRSKSDREVDRSDHVRSSKVKGQEIECLHMKSNKSATQHHVLATQSHRNTSSKFATHSMHLSSSLEDQSNKSCQDFMNASKFHNVSELQLSSQQQLRLDLSSLVGDKDNEDEILSARNAANLDCAQHHIHSSREEEYAHTPPSEKSSGLFSSSSNLPWKPGVKRCSSLNNSPLKSPSRPSILRSALLPSKSKTLENFDVKSPSSSTIHMDQTQTSFFSPHETRDTVDTSPFSDFPGYRETLSQRNEFGTEGYCENKGGEDCSSDMEIISPPPLFCSPETPSTTSMETQGLSSPPEVSGEKTEISGTSPSLYVERPRRLPFPATTDPAVQEAWSRDENYLLEVLRHKLSSRRQRQPDPETDHLVYIENGNDSQCSLATPLPHPTNQMATMSDAPDRKEVTDDSDEMEKYDDVSEHSIELESSLEKQDHQGNWIRVLCSLKKPNLLVFSKEGDLDSSPGVAELTECGVTELIDQIQGKRFVIKLDHVSAPPILLSLDTRDDLAVWRHGILASLRRSRQAHKQTTPISRSEQQQASDNATTPTDGKRCQTSSSSAQSIKQKLLAEMLRQREELERMQAIRAEMKTTGQAPPTDPLVLDEERIIALTRLRQRRMSTQIKLQTIQRQIESAISSSPRDRKSTFLPLGKKKAPDLLLPTQHATEDIERDQEDSRTVLQAQVKRLSSRLQDLDENISCHEASAATSPKEDMGSLLLHRKHSPLVTNQNVLRHSLDPSCLPSDLGTSLRDSDFLEDAHEDLTSFGKVERYDSSEASLGVGSPRISGVNSRENYGKDTGGSNSKSSPSGGFKSSVQKLAHRTFSKATNWNWAKKNAPPAPSTSLSISSPILVEDGWYNNNNNNNTIPNVINEDGCYGNMTTSFSSGRLSDHTPDVVDVTSRDSRDFFSSSRDHLDCRPRKSRDDSDLPSVLGYVYPVEAMDGKEAKLQPRILHHDNSNFGHRTPEDKVLSKLASSTSLSGISRFDGRLHNFSSSSPDLALDNSHPHPPLASDSKDIEHRAKSGLKGSGHSNPTWRPTSLALPSCVTPTTSRSCPLVSRTGSATSSSPSPRGSEGKAVTPRREVNPDALAQIEAFEELSMRYLGAATK